MKRNDQFLHKTLITGGRWAVLLMAFNVVRTYLMRPHDFEDVPNVASTQEIPALTTWSPDARTLVSAFNKPGDEELVLWDVVRRVRRTLPIGQHSHGVGISFSADGQKLASLTQKPTSNKMVTELELWDLAANELYGMMELTGALSRLALASDGNTVATVGRDGRAVNLWNVPDGKLVRRLKGGHSVIWSLSFAPDGATLAVGSIDKTIRLWNVQTGNLRRTIVGHGAAIAAVTFTPDGKQLASAGSIDKTVRLWDVRTGELLRVLSGRGNMSSVAFSHDGKTIAAGCGSWGSNKSIAVDIWDVDSGQKKQTLTCQPPSVDSIAFSADAKLLASASSDGTARLWHIR